MIWSPTSVSQASKSKGNVISLAPKPAEISEAELIIPDSTIHRGIGKVEIGLKTTCTITRLHRSSVLRRSAHALNPKLPKMMVQMLIHQRRPFLRSQRPEKEVRMPRATPRPAHCKAVNEFS